MASVTALGAIVISNALAVHDLDFQLDGDVDETTVTNLPDPPGTATQTVDWDTLFTADGNDDGDDPDAITPFPTGFEAATSDRDFRTNANGSFNTADPTTFATGSKDTLPITPGWQCNFDNNVNSKTDVMNAYAASYTAGGSDILYFALERNANTGDGNVGFWFLQDENVACESPGGSTPFEGNHVDGDLLVVSEFSNGGTVADIKAYEWEGGANGSLNPTPVADGADCATTDTDLPDDKTCAMVNDGTITTPWLTANKQDGVGNDLRISEFFEGGVDLTAVGLGGKCFNTFIADTRSSTSLTATIFDFSLGQLGECTSETVTDPVESDGTTPLPDPPAGIELPASGSIDVKDQATVTVTGVSDWSGTVTFHLCGPFAVDSTTLCNNDPDDPDTQGTQIGAAKAVSDENPVAVSDAATITEGGRYCWRADFSGDEDAGVPPSSDSRATECFVITVPTAISTHQRVFPNDSATITLGSGSGTLPANGTVVFRLYGPSSGGTPTALENCQAHGDTVGSGGLLYKETKDTGAAAASQTVGTTNGNDPTAPPDVSVDTNGKLYWWVTYDPDEPGFTGRQSDCVENTDLTFVNDPPPSP